MKTILSIFFCIGLSGILCSQTCIQKYIGMYKVDLDRTIEQTKANDPSKANENPSKIFIEMSEKVSLELTKNTMVVFETGKDEKIIEFSSKKAEKKDFSCDLVLKMPEETLSKLPEGVEIPSFNLSKNKDGRLHIVDTSNISRRDFQFFPQINNIIWRKIE